ncbi:MAG TPA: hypothetical protein VFE24_00495 [Pirellulales bacterium]|jgi:hypothetical protein|nr:hypothetical protein [Pirellulales bacterium]
MTRRSSLSNWLLSVMLATAAIGLQLAIAQKEPAAPADGKAAGAKKDNGETKFIRLVRNDKGDVTAMQTAVVSYVPKDKSQAGLQVDLVGAVHVADKAYYEQLNKLFEKYDVVCYELVAPEGTKIQKGETSSRHPIGALQNGMKDMLGLEHQLSCIDYNAKNFVHADMSPDEFSKTMADRGETIWTMIFRAMGSGMAQQSNRGGNGPSEIDILMALFDHDRADALKRVVAEQFEDMEGMSSAFNGPDGSAILTERNKKALEVLKKEIDGGKKKIAIFYGAAHLPDMEKRLEKEFDLKRADEKWLTAWDIKPKQK